MIEQLKYVSVFWRDNEISISECANSVYEFLLTLKKHNNILFNEWYEKGGSKKEGLKKKVEISQEYLSNIVKKNWDKKNLI